jgi:hypothetical protein
MQYGSGCGGVADPKGMFTAERAERGRHASFRRRAGWAAFAAGGARWVHSRQGDGGACRHRRGAVTGTTLQRVPAGTGGGCLGQRGRMRRRLTV